MMNRYRITIYGLIVLVLSSTTAWSVEDLSAKAAILGQYANFKDTNKFDSDIIVEFVVKNNGELYDSIAGAYSGILASSLMWANILNSLPNEPSKVEFLMRLAETESGLLPDEPNPFKGALVSLASLFVTDDIKYSHVLKYLENYRTLERCEKEYVVALGILADLADSTLKCKECCKGELGACEHPYRSKRLSCDETNLQTPNSGRTLQYRADA